MEYALGMASSWIDLLSNQSINASVIFLVVLAATRLLRGRGPSIHVALWTLVFVRLFLPPSLAHPWSSGALIYHFLEPQAAASSLQFSASDLMDGARSGNGVVIDAAISESRLKTLGLGIGWLVGVTAVLVYFRRRLAPFHRHLRGAGPVHDPLALDLVDRWRCRLGISRRVRIVTSPDRFTPFTLGVVRPVIFVPESIVSDHGSIESVIAHEMAHVARWDALWLGLQHLVHAAFFFHPLVWIAGARLDSAREKLCDATVVAAGRISARTYVGGLLNVLQLDLQGVGAPTMTSRKRRIDVRIRSVLARAGGPRPRPAAATAVVFLIGIFVLPLGPGGVVASGDESSPRPSGENRLASNLDVLEFENPLPGGRVTWRWGKGLDPWTKEVVFHRGIDVAAKAGTVVRAPADGVIGVATEHFEESPASGTVILIDHGDGWTTFYAHLGSLEVAEKQKVSKNDVIATVGSTGKSTGPHLHFEIRHQGEHVNPAEFVNDWK